MAKVRSGGLSLLLHAGVAAVAVACSLGVRVRPATFELSSSPFAARVVEPREEMTSFDTPRPTPERLPVAEAAIEFEPALRVLEEPEPAPPVPKAEPPAPRFDRPSRVTFAQVPLAPALVSETAAVEIQNPPPVYPLAARRRGIEGEVLVQIEIAADGVCSSASVAGSSGSALLDDAATAAVRDWLFRPATRDGKAIASTQKIRFVFTLKS